jgi:hypothetical protein
MKTSTFLGVYLIATFAVLLLLTAWGNALAMFVVSALALIVGGLAFGRHYPRPGILAGLAGWAAAVAFVVAWVLQHR